jgi:hypothetical protein
MHRLDILKTPKFSTKLSLCVQNCIHDDNKQVWDHIWKILNNANMHEDE